MWCKMMKFPSVILRPSGGPGINRILKRLSIQVILQVIYDKKCVCPEVTQVEDEENN